MSSLIYPIVLLGMASGHSHAGNVYEITETRVVQDPSTSLKVGATSSERFGFVTNSPRKRDQGNTPLPLDWDVPKGWQVFPETSMRIVNLRVAGHREAECYLSILPGRAGGVTENINRWRKQMSLAPLSAEEILGLPKKKLFGNDAVYIECDGTFVGMRGDIEKRNYRLAGMILGQNNFTVFVKMVGPKDILESEMSNFYYFCSSLRVLPETSVNSGDREKSSSPQQPDVAKLSWEAPHAWVQGSERAMRLVTYQTAPNKKTECYISVFPGNAGGVVQNVNRWRHQMGLSELDPEAVEELPVLEILGEKATFIEIKGNYTGMSGPTQSAFMMLGVVCPLSDQTLFVKMIGPIAEVINERENFLSFCRSLKLP